ncbi:hypothetical protein [Micromonospora sp. ATA51]|uniref:hypothetical protein n=1 Tax=Micromonospora sp. ATA51 TaxID=2806098 RepID=UPI001EE4CDDF|nr:hypothetical protein [Micromonospora sp. ATA51]
MPRQLPASPQSFAGRVRELLELDSVIGGRSDRRGTVVISAIGGAGGVGKTWPALRWSHDNLERFPDGQLYVNLRGFDPDGDPVPPAVAVRGFLAASWAGTGEPSALPRGGSMADELEELRAAARAKGAEFAEHQVVTSAENTVAHSRMRELGEESTKAYRRIAAARGRVTKALKDGDAEKIAAAHAHLATVQREFEAISDANLAESFALNRASLDRAILVLLALTPFLPHATPLLAAILAAAALLAVAVADARRARGKPPEAAAPPY